MTMLSRVLEQNKLRISKLQRTDVLPNCSRPTQLPKLSLWFCTFITCLKHIRRNMKQHYVLSSINFLHEEQFFLSWKSLVWTVCRGFWPKWTTIKHTWPFSLQAPKYQISRSAKQRLSKTEVLLGRHTASHYVITLCTLHIEQRLCCFLKCVMGPVPVPLRPT